MKNNTFKQTEIGEIPEDWNIQTLVEMSEFITDGSHWSPKPYHGMTNYKIATVKDMQENGFNLDTCKPISPDDFSKLLNQKCVPQKGDVAIAKDGSYLKHVFAISKDQDIALLSSIAIIRTNANKLLPLYLKYYLKTDSVDRRVKDNYVSGAVIPRIILKDFEKIKIAKPSVSEQHQIASILTSLDDKIELNRRMNSTLEEIGKALFKRWFVDFEFPNENGEPYKSSDGEMVESELGEIPKGWKVTKLDEIIEITSGKRPENKSETKSDDNKIPIIGASGVMGFTSKLLYDEKIICTGRVGTLGVVRKINYPCWMSDNTLVIKSDFYEFVYFTLSSIDFSSYNVGSTQPLITQSSIKNIKIVHPHNKLLNQFEEAVSVLTLQNISNTKEIGSLEGIRDSLLPRLMSGKLRVI